MLACEMRLGSNDFAHHAWSCRHHYIGGHIRQRLRKRTLPERLCGNRTPLLQAIESLNGPGNNVTDLAVRSCDSIPS